MSEHRRGRIWTEYWIDCADCDKQERLDGANCWSGGNRDAKARGWSRYDLRSWRCSACEEKRRTRR